MEKKATVIGANGFIGTALCKELLDNEYYVEAVYNRNRDSTFKSKNIHYVKYDDLINDEDKLEKSDYLFNVSWSGIKGTAMADYALQISNIAKTIEIIKIAKVKEAKYIHTGSIIELESYNNIFKTNDSTKNTHVYGAAKFAAHVFSKHLADSEKIEYSCGLITNAYGPGEKNPRLINDTINKVKKGEIPSFSEGNQVYDFVYITDVAKALRLIAEKGSNKCYTIGSGKAKKLKYFLAEINEIVAPEIQFIYGRTDVPVDYLDNNSFSIEELTKDTGYRPTVDFKDGIKKMMNHTNYIRKNNDIRPKGFD